MAMKILALCTLLLAGVGHQPEPMEKTNMDETATAKEVKEHIVSIFEAYVHGDRATIEKTHSQDWFGFMLPSHTIVSGRAGYMQGADTFLANVDMLRYDIYDSEVKVYGDVVVVCYLAKIWVRDRASSEEQMVHMRALDVYRKDADGWIQCASNINTVPE